MSAAVTVAEEIRYLARDMVRLDALIAVARQRQAWAEVGTLTNQRLSVQAHRSNLMVERFRARHQLNWRYVG